MRYTLLLLVIGPVLLAACSTEQQPAVPPEFYSVDTRYESRGVTVAATIVTPGASGGHALPLVVFAHGHGGSRQEGGGFQMVAEALAKRGIASIRMDFPGCGDSTESFTENNLSNMLLDLQAARVYAEGRLDIDSERVGLLGYSMGGRLVALLSEIDPGYKAMVMWTPAMADGAQREFDSLGGPEAYAAYKEKASSTGMAEFTTQWGTTLQLGYQWFIDLEESRPLESLAKFEGPLLVIYGDQDSVVVPATSEATIAAAQNSSEVARHVVAGAEHALGFYTDKPEYAAEVVNATAEFFSERL